MLTLAAPLEEDDAAALVALPLPEADDEEPVAEDEEPDELAVLEPLLLDEEPLDEELPAGTDFSYTPPTTFLFVSELPALEAAFVNASMVLPDELRGAFVSNAF